MAADKERGLLRGRRTPPASACSPQAATRRLLVCCLAASCLPSSLSFGGGGVVLRDLGLGRRHALLDRPRPGRPAPGAGPGLGTRVCGGPSGAVLQMSASGRRGKGGDDGKLARSDEGEGNSGIVKGSQLLRKLLRKLESRAEKFEKKVSGKLDKWEEKSDFKGQLVKLSESPALVVVAAGACILAVPAAMTVFALSAIAFQITLLAISPILVVLSSALSLAQPLIMPRLLPALSIAMTASAAMSAGILVKFPKSRSVSGLLTSTIIPALAWWLSTIQVRALQLVSLPGIIDPVRPFGLDPMFRPLLTDPFFRDLWQLLPRPLLYSAPTTVLVKKATTLPFMRVKIAISVAALLVTAWYWYQERSKVAEAVALRSIEATARDVTLEDEDYEELEGERMDRLFKDWESKYKMRPEASKDPSQWSVDDVSFQLEKAGLGACIDAFRRGKIDGRVALTLTREDEDELRDELGVTKLGERRRLMLFLDDLREMQRASNELRAAEREGGADMRPRKEHFKAVDGDAS